MVFLLKLVFFKNSHSPCRKEEDFWKTKNKKKYNKKVAKLLTYDGQVIDPTAYIYICCCVRKWGAFLRFNRSIMLPFMRSKMGCAESGAWNPYFYIVSGGGARTSYSRGCAKYRAWSWGIMPKMRLFKTQFCSLYMASSSGLDRVWSRFFVAMCKNAQNCGRTGVFTLPVSNLQHEGQNRGFRKKAKIYFWCRTHHHFCDFRCRASFLQKNGVSKIDEISLKPLKT